MKRKKSDPAPKTMKFQLENRLYNNIMRAATKHVIRTNEKPVLQGVCVEVESDKVRFTALDGYHMVHYCVPLTGCENLRPATFVMPVMVMAARAGYVEIDYSDVGGDFGRIHVTDMVTDVMISRRVYNGDFMNWRNVIQPEYEKPVSIVVNVQYMMDTLAAAIATSDRYDHKIAKITFDANNRVKPVTVTRRGAFGDVTNLVLPVKTTPDGQSNAEADARQFDGEI